MTKPCIAQDRKNNSLTVAMSFIGAGTVLYLAICEHLLYLVNAQLFQFLALEMLK